MGFLSRRNKSVKSAPTSVQVEEEAHPIVEELQAMEEAVPEQPLAAGPVAEGSPPAHPREGQPSTPPAEGASPVEAEKDEAPAEDVEPERFMPRDLIAPSRHEAVVEEPVVEVPTKHADVIAFRNQKGGVAKTTTTLNLAVAFAESGYRVLCIDLDPQGNLTISQGIDPDTAEQ